MMQGVVFFIFLALFFLAFKYIYYKIFLNDAIQAALERDPAATGALAVIFTYAGVQVLAYYQLAHWFYKMRFYFAARLISQIGRWLTGIEIHPGATIGKGLFIDHGMGVVFGETAVLGDNVTIFQGVTLGGTGKEKGKRHPTLGNNVVVGAGAKILGNIVIGDNVSVGANSVVIESVPPNCTVVGVPGRVARREGKKVLGINVDYTNLPDPLTQALQGLEKEIQKIEHELKDFGASDKERN